MLSETEKYRLSLYVAAEIIKNDNLCLIEKVICTLDGKIYIKRTYPDDKREIFNVLFKIKSKYIPKITEVFFDYGTIVIEEYIHGESLTKILDESKINAKQAESFARQTFEALADLHAHDIVHRDVKPDNIIIGENGALHLIDFGIARLCRKGLVRDTETLGTVGYAPPEQFGFSQTDFRADIYSSGVTIEDVCKSAKCRPGSALMKVALKCKEFDPNRRYDSAGAVLRDISRKGRKVRMAVLLLIMAVVVACAAVYFNMRQSVEYQNPGSQAEQFADEKDMDWKHILDFYYLDKPCLYAPISAGTSGNYEASLADEKPKIKMDWDLTNDILNLTLNDGVLPEQNFSFGYAPGIAHDYADTAVEAEIVFFDMDGDGQNEILIALSDRKRMSGANDVLLCNTNWRVVWCIGHTANEGFWLADGMVSTDSNENIFLNMMDSNELYTYTDGVVVLKDRKLQ